MQEPKNSWLIEDRFKAVHCVDQIKIFDVKRPKVGGHSLPIGIVPLKNSESERNAYMLALTWLREQRHIDPLEFFESHMKLISLTRLKEKGPARREYSQKAVGNASTLDQSMLLPSAANSSSDLPAEGIQTGAVRQ
jgi:hypothetical protein